MPPTLTHAQALEALVSALGAVGLTAKRLGAALEIEGRLQLTVDKTGTITLRSIDAQGDRAALVRIAPAMPSRFALAATCVASALPARSYPVQRGDGRVVRVTVPSRD